MFADRRIKVRCDSCGHVNEFPLNYFVSKEDIIDSHVIASCHSCRCDFVMDLFEADIY